jgi:integrase
MSQDLVPGAKSGPKRSRGRLRKPKDEREVREDDGRRALAEARRAPPTLETRAELDKRLASLKTGVVDLAKAATSPATLAAYASDWAHFETFCRRFNLSPLPAQPSTVALYIQDCIDEGLKASTIRRRIAAIAAKHRTAKHPSPTQDENVRLVAKGMSRTLGNEQRQAAALSSAEIRAIVGKIDQRNLTGQRDTAMLLLSFAGVLRRSELVGLQREQVKFVSEGVELRLSRSKGDQEARGEIVPIPRGKNPTTCPVRALERWLEASDIRYGPLFRKISRYGTLEFEALAAGSWWQILRDRAKAAGVTGTTREPVSPHGLRRGGITEAYRGGASEAELQAWARHKDSRTTRRYVAVEAGMSNSPAKKTGL